MQEILHIYDSRGEVLLERDLESEKGPLLVTAADGVLALASTSSAESEILVALVRDEDGWSLAATDAEHPILSGAKEVQELHLTPGLPCRVGRHVYRLERAMGESGAALIWRYAGSPVAVDYVIGGRNVVSFNRETNTPDINAAGGEELFGFYPTAEGYEIEAGANSTDRLSVEDRLLFSVGEFEGMFLPAAEASKAIATKDPFAWPARKIRRALNLASFALLGLFAFALVCQYEVKQLKAVNAGYRGAVETPLMTTPADVVDRDDYVVYNITFYRNMPLVLTAKPNGVTLDLIQRGSVLAPHDRSIAAKIAFLKDVRTIQESILTGRWDMLRDVLAAADQKMFVECDADHFLADAKEVADGFIERLPKIITESSEVGKSAEFDEACARYREIYEGLSDNIFLQGDVLRREREVWQARFDTVAKYLVSRDKFLGKLAEGEDAYVSENLSMLYDTYSDLMSLIAVDTPGFEIFYARERTLLSEKVSVAAEKIVAEAKEDLSGRRTVLLYPLANIGEAVQLDGKKLEGWRSVAKIAAKKVDARCRSLYSSYRLRTLEDDAGAQEILDELIAVGDNSNRFHAWAVKEKERIAAKKSVGTADKAKEVQE